jgi:hypothetical protein
VSRLLEEVADGALDEADGLHRRVQPVSLVGRPGGGLFAELVRERGISLEGTHRGVDPGDSVSSDVLETALSLLGGSSPDGKQRNEAREWMSRLPPAELRQVSLPGPEVPRVVGAVWPADERPYHPGYYAAFLLDPDGNSIEAVYHGEAARSAASVKIAF